MKVLSFIGKKILVPACLYFTTLIFVFSVIVNGISKTAEITLPFLFLSFTIATLLSLIDLLLTWQKISYILRVLLHMVLSVVAISLTIAAFSAAGVISYAPSSRSFYLVIALIVIYLVLWLPCLLLRHFYEKKKTAADQSKSDPSLFSKK